MINSKEAICKLNWDLPDKFDSYPDDREKAPQKEYKGGLKKDEYQSK